LVLGGTLEGGAPGHCVQEGEEKRYTKIATGNPASKTALRVAWVQGKGVTSDEVYALEITGDYGFDRYLRG